MLFTRYYLGSNPPVTTKTGSNVPAIKLNLLESGLVKMCLFASHIFQMNFFGWNRDKKCQTIISLNLHRKDLVVDALLRPSGASWNSPGLRFTLFV